MKGTIFMNAQEVAEKLGVSKAAAYKMIHTWNEKLQQMGYHSGGIAVGSGAAVQNQYFHCKCFLSSSVISD